MMALLGPFPFILGEELHAASSAPQLSAFSSLVSSQLKRCLVKEGNFVPLLVGFALNLLIFLALLCSVRERFSTGSCRQIGDYLRKQNIQFIIRISIRQMEQDEFDSQNSVAYEDPGKIEYVNVKRHISEANSLLSGFGFEPYYPKTVFDSKLDCFHASKGKSTNHSTNNKLDTLLLDTLLGKDKSDQPQDQTDANNPSGTLTDIYKERLPLYQKFGARKKKYFASEIVSLKPGKKILKSTHKLMIPDQHIYIDSGFEFGNLCKVYKVSQHSYQLILQNDVNTRGNNQWFFFRVRGAFKNTVLKFEIVNLIKKESLFSEGMKPTVFSKIRYETKGIGWIREGERVQYFPNTIKKEHRDGHYYSLAFEYKVMNEDDEIYFSHSYPYTYSDLNNYMKSVFSETYPDLILSLGVVGESIAGNRVDVLTVTGKNYDKNKKVVWVLARQHPGEITSSFVVEGIINTLLSENEWVRHLRENVIFKIVPMVNPDGVIHGNSRCELVGADPNRRWRNPSKNLNPIIYNLKQMITKSTHANTNMVLDLHSHSRKFGTFFYGNSDKEKEKSRVYPLIVCQNDERFSFSLSRFSEGPKSTARYSLHKLLGIPNVFTVESSFYGFEKNSRIVEYYPDDYRDLGRSLLEGYAMMLNEECPKLERLNFASALERLQEEPKLMEEGDKLSAGSDSDPSGDELDIEELNKLLPKKLDLSKRKKKVVKRKAQTKQVMVSVKQQPKPEVKEEVKKQNLCQIRKKSASLLPITRKYSTSTTKRREIIPSQYILNNSSKCIQTQQAPLFRQINRSGNCLGRLMIVGQKVEDREIWLEGNNQIGVQSTGQQQGLNNGKGEMKRPARVFRLLSEFKENRTCFRDWSRKH